MAFSILIGGLLLDVLISITLGVSALPVNIIIGTLFKLGVCPVHMQSCFFFVPSMQDDAGPEIHCQVSLLCLDLELHFDLPWNFAVSGV